MLPAPVSFQRHTNILNHPLRHFSKLTCPPARQTIPNALLLAALLTLSVLLNLRFLYCSLTRDGSAVTPLLHSIVDTLPARPAASPYLDHLVVVPGHSIWVGVRPEDAEVEDGWLLGGYQMGRRSPSLFYAHIARR